MGDVIKNINFARQVAVFKGLKWGSISPTDIDGFIDFCDRLFVFIELKYGTGLPNTGQRIALERLCDACTTDRRVAAVLVASHNTRADIQVNELQVIQYRWNRRWLIPEQYITVHDAVDRLLEKSGIFK